MSADLQRVSLLSAEVIDLDISDEFGPVIMDILIFSGDSAPIDRAIVIDVFGDDGWFAGDVGFDDELVGTLSADHCFQVIVIGLSGEVCASGSEDRVIRIIGAESFTIGACGAGTGVFVILCNCGFPGDCVGVESISAASSADEFSGWWCLKGNSTSGDSQHHGSSHQFLQHLL